MIPENDRQAGLLRARIERVRSNLNGLDGWDAIRSGLAPSSIEAKKRNLREQLGRLLSDIEAYDAVKSGSVSEFSADRIEDVPDILKKARIARGLTQRQFGDLLGVKEQQIQRYEADNYQGLSLHRLFDIASALRLRFSITAQFDEPSPVDDAKGHPSIPVGQLPFREMAKRGWIRDSASSAITLNSAAAYVQTQLGGRAGGFLHRQVVRSNAVLNEFALLAWQARICEVARSRRQEIGKIDFFSTDLSWIRGLVSLSRYEDGPTRAVSTLRELGVLVVIEPHLEGTHLDGAATVVDGEIPVVGLTLRHDRLDNFWFVLFHEMAHLTLHAQKEDLVSFFDAEEGQEISGREAEADEFARTAFIPDEKWKSSLIRFSNSSESVRAFAENNGIGAAIVAGRIRQERRNFSVFSDLVGFGEVRRQFYS